MTNNNLMDLKETVAHGDFQFPMNIYSGEFLSNQFNLYLHWHNEMEIIYVKSGFGKVYIDMNFFDINCGDIIIINKEALHYLYNNTDTALKYEAIIFDLRLLQNSFLDYCQVNFINPLIENNLKTTHIIKNSSVGYDEILFYVCKIIKSYNDSAFGFQLQIKGLLFNLFYELFNREYIQKPNYELISTNNKILKLKNVIKYIYDNYNKPLHINELSKIAGYSEYHFIRFFKSQTGKTCTNFINALRIEKSLDLLINTNLSITEIAFNVGYDDVSYFIKVFKRLTSSTPSNYRKNFCTT